MSVSLFEETLTGGHPNSLGKTEEVVAEVLKETDKLEELYKCYFSEDAVVRLRVSSAWKRVAKHDIELFLPYVDRFIEEISLIEQASTQWTIAYLFEYSAECLTDSQKKKAVKILKKNLEQSTDWIVLKNTMTTLHGWAKEDASLKKWLIPRLERLSEFPNKVVPQTAAKLLETLK